VRRLVPSALGLAALAVACSLRLPYAVDVAEDADDDVEGDSDTDDDSDTDGDADVDTETDAEAEADPDEDADTDADSPVSVWTMCVDTGSTGSTGILYDSGGPTWEYRDNESCEFLIAPTPAPAEIVLTVVELGIEADYDYLYVYDGGSTTARLLSTLTGFSVPTDPLVATSGRMLVQLTTDGGVIADGFRLDWETR
jgi:hypothetical protein